MKEFSRQESLIEVSYKIRHASRMKCLGVGALALISAAGCADRNKDNIPESPATGGEINQTLDKAGDAATSAVEKAGDAAEKVGDAAGDAATTATVKSAIMANKTLDSTKINVDTKKNIVYLRGTVASDAQSKLAVAITKKSAPDHSINNLLKVAGKAPAKAPAKSAAK